jgi:hypothetical protein
MLNDHLTQTISRTKFKTPLNFMRYAILEEIDRFDSKMGTVFKFWYEHVQTLEEKDIEPTLQEFRWGALEPFAYKHLENYLKKRYEYYEEEIANFEKKYQLKWEEMYASLGEITESGRYDIFELEDDFMDWTSCRSFANSSKNQLNEFQNGRN